MLDDPITSRQVAGDYKISTWNGDEKRIIAYAVDDKRQYNFNATHPADISERETSDAANNGDDTVGKFILCVLPQNK